MTKRIFISGTDTGVGKTSFTAAWLQQLNQKGYTTQAIKPIASGGDEDALALQAAMSLDLPLKQVNPIRFDEPIAPHIEAMKNNFILDANLILQAVETNIDTRADLCLIEGAGGWLCPLNNQETYADAVIRAAWPVILVVGLRLGCLNHTMLTIHQMQRYNIEVLGWVANVLSEPMPYLFENIAYLEESIPAPRIATFHSGHRLSEVVTSPALNL